MIVLDASAALAWLLDDESTALADRAAERLMKERAVVPAIFPAEISNAIRYAVKRKRIAHADAEAILQRLAQLPIEIDTISLEIFEEFGLAVTHDLSIYDALYLGLAKRRQLPLYTLDLDLQRAAQKENVAPAEGYSSEAIR